MDTDLYYRGGGRCTGPWLVLTGENALNTDLYSGCGGDTVDWLVLWGRRCTGDWFVLWESNTLDTGLG